MKKGLFIILIFLKGFISIAQQRPHYTQYVLNQYILNPALTGIENYTDVKISHRHQWVGLDGAPVTTYLTVHTAIGKKDYVTSPTSYRVPGENPRGESFWKEYAASEPHHGVGLTVLNDRTGPLNRFSAFGTYAYHVGLSGRTTLAAGFGAGISNLSLNAGKLDFGPSSPVDPAVSGSKEINNVKPELNAGVYLYSSDYFAGFSAQQIIPQRIIFSEDSLRKTEGRYVPHLFATLGYRFLLTEDFNLIPSVMLKYSKPAPIQVDLNIKLQYMDFAWIGASYRTGDGFAAMLGMNVSNTFNIGYSYDYTTSNLNTVSKGTHEILVGFLIGNKYGDWCPRNVW